MTDHTEHRPTAVSITDVDSLGQAHIRTWHVCNHTTDQIAAILGPPTLESVLSPQAADTISDTYITTPGVVTTHLKEH